MQRNHTRQRSLDGLGHDHSGVRQHALCAARLATWSFGTASILALGSRAQLTTTVSAPSINTLQSDFLCSSDLDGRFIAFASSDPFLVPDSNGVQDVFVHDRQASAAGRIVRASEYKPSVFLIEADLPCSNPSISGHGERVAFETSATNLDPFILDNNALPDIYVRDMNDITSMIHVSVSMTPSGQQANGASGNAVISSDGLFVAFESDASNLVPGDTNGVRDIFVRDLTLGTTVRVSVAHLTGAEATNLSEEPSISGHGRFIAFSSLANNLVAGDAILRDVFVRDMNLGTTTMVSVATSGVQANSESHHPSISGDGKVVAFDTRATNLDPLDTLNTNIDVYVRDLVAQTTVLVSRTAPAPGQPFSFPPAVGNADSVEPSVSANGQFIAYETIATNLGPVDTNGVADVIVFDRIGITNQRASVDSAGLGATGGPSQLPAISGNGVFVAFPSSANNLVTPTPNFIPQIFVRDLLVPSPIAYCVAKVNSQGCTPTIHSQGVASASAGGGFVVLGSNVRNQKTGQLFYGSSGQANIPFQGGTLCVAGPIARTIVINSGGSPLPIFDCSGVYAIDMNAFATGALGGNPQAFLLGAGTTVNCQYWGRDPGFPAPFDTTLSDGLQYVIGP